FGMMLCGYLGENFGWSWGFGLAGVFMLFGMLQFWLAKDLFGKIGGKPVKTGHEEDLNAIDANSPEAQAEKLNPFTGLDYILIVFSSVAGLLYLFNDPLEKISGFSLAPFVLWG